jgi:hypothetical protein
MTKLQQLILSCLTFNNQEDHSSLFPLVNNISTKITIEKEEHGMVLLKGILDALKEKSVIEIFGVPIIKNTGETVVEYHKRDILKQIKDLNIARAHFEISSTVSKLVSELDLTSIEVARILSEKVTKLIND